MSTGQHERLARESAEEGEARESTRQNERLARESAEESELGYTN